MPVLYEHLLYNDQINKCTEAEFMLRTAAAHEFYVQAVSNNESLVPSYGVVKSSRFDVISGFSPVTAFPADIMYDCLEGVLPQFLHSLFRHLQNNGICSFALINQRLKNFKFGATDKRNKPRPLPGNVILFSGKISLSASETFYVCLEIYPLLLEILCQHLMKPGKCIIFYQMQWTLFWLNQFVLMMQLNYGN